jgi:hypothetical protein
MWEWTSEIIFVVCTHYKEFRERSMIAVIVYSNIFLNTIQIIFSTSFGVDKTL